MSRAYRNLFTLQLIITDILGPNIMRVIFNNDYISVIIKFLSYIKLKTFLLYLITAQHNNKLQLRKIYHAIDLLQNNICQRLLINRGIFP